MINTFNIFKDIQKIYDEEYVKALEEKLENPKKEKKSA